MGFDDFRIRVLVRVILLVLTITAAIWLYLTRETLFITIFLSSIAIIQVYELYFFVTQTNRKLTKFLESVKYSDFISGFASGNKLGKSFRELNAAFNEVMDAFRKARSDKEEHWQYLNTVVEHVSVGVISFDHDGNVGLVNAAAKKLIGIEQLRNIEELIESNSRLYKALFDIPPGKSALFKTRTDVQLSLQATEIKLGDIVYKLVAIQNIQPELQKKELEAWQNLTRILRHEIMNSIAPIASLTSTMKDIITDEVKESGENFSEDSIDDLEEGLITIEDRSKGLIKFINAYRDYTTIPLPDIKPVSAREILERTITLMKSEMAKKGIEYTLSVDPDDMTIQIDEEQIEQVLINMVKNSVEAFAETKNPQIAFSARLDDEGNQLLIIEDNGKGIIREALEKIFIPFFTTKTEGSGIGLALSRQIMQLHNGTIRVESEPDSFTRFTLQF